ncbi:uncharacterized protein [Diabrotica undecimpunctata]|uniref:uncharacterized protein n=1 Tax=Diabrotica undecimpunctata TaxID=50387 RepID=UPI003B637083
MKVLVVLSVVIAAAMATYGGGGYGGGGGYNRGRIQVYQNFFLPPQEKDILHNYHLECQQESQCGMEYIRSPHQYESYQPLGEYMFCICQKYGFMYPNGRFNYNMLSRKLGLVCVDEDPEIYIRGCAVPSHNPYSTALGLINCLDNYGFHYLDQCVY